MPRRTAVFDVVRQLLIAMQELCFVPDAYALPTAAQP